MFLNEYIDWGTTHVTEGHLLYSKSPDLNVNVMEKTPNKQTLHSNI